MQFSKIIQVLAIAGLASSAPIELEDREAAPAVHDDSRLPVLANPDHNVVVTVKRNFGPFSVVTRRPLPTSTTTTTTSKTTTTTSSTTTKSTTTTTSTIPTGIFTSVPISACPTAVNTNPGTPDFNQIPTSCGQSWLDIVNMWRRAYNLPTFTWSAHSAQVAYGAAYNASGGAKPFVHSNLGYWGTSAEVESPGYQVPFQPMYGMTPFSGAIANWLCEVPSDPQLKVTGFTGIDLCTTIVRNTDYIGENPAETGHHDILVSTSYTKIGCAFVFNQMAPSGPFAGLYVCDFEF